MENHQIQSLGQRLYLLRELYGRVWSILATVCRGDLLVPDGKLSMYYVKLCLTIESLLEEPDLSDLQKDYHRPFDSLHTLQDCDIMWEEGEEPYVANFFGKIEERWIAIGTPVYSATELSDFLREIDESIKHYEERKKKIVSDFWTKVKEREKENKLGELTKEKSVQQKEILPDNQFIFVTDDILRKVIQRDYEELKRVYDIGASKSVMVLSGGILETLLIEALFVEEEKAKFDYYQKYLEAKDKNAKPSDLQNWQLYQLIEIAAQRKIISADVKKMAFTIEGYRNLIHLKAEIRDKLSIDKNVATSVVHLLLKAVDDISKWFKDRNLK